MMWENKAQVALKLYWVMNSYIRNTFKTCHSMSAVEITDTGLLTLAHFHQEVYALWILHSDNIWVGINIHVGVILILYVSVM